MVLVSIALSGVVIFVTLTFAVRSTTFWQGVDGVKDWDSLCEVEDCNQFPPLHMTYEVDGTHYYFPASTNLPDLTINYGPSFFGVLPIGHKRDESRYRRSIAVVSKAPMLHGRHVYGHCNYTCRFYSLWFRDAPFNEEPLLMVEMQGDDIDVMLHPSCSANPRDPACSPEKLNFSNIRLRFDMVEQVVESLRTRPAISME